MQFAPGTLSRTPGDRNGRDPLTASAERISSKPNSSPASAGLQGSHTGNGRKSSYFRAWVRKAEGQWVLEHKKDGVMNVQLAVTDAVMAKLVNIHTEFKILATLNDGTLLVEPYFSNSGRLAQQVQAETATKKSRSDRPRPKG